MDHLILPPSFFPCICSLKSFFSSVADFHSHSTKIIGQAPGSSTLYHFLCIQSCPDKLLCLPKGGQVACYWNTVWIPMTSEPCKSVLFDSCPDVWNYTSTHLSESIMFHSTEQWGWGGRGQPCGMLGKQEIVECSFGMACIRGLLNTRGVMPMQTAFILSHLCLMSRFNQKSG